MDMSDKNVTMLSRATKQLQSYGFSIGVLVLFLIVFILTGAVNTKVDGINNEKQTIGYGRVGAGANTPYEVVWTQPKMTIIKSITLVCTTAATVATGDIGYKVGTTSGGVDIVAAVTDQILDGGTTVPVGATYALTLASSTTASDAAPATNKNFTAVKRKLYFDITHTTAAEENGEGYFNWVIEYQAV
jgi:hypothetical protein